ncbi:MAG: sodium:proton antiporter [Alphaproteobacteria bacterium]
MHHLTIPFYTMIPFVGVLLSLSLCPLLFPRFWNFYQNKILFGWALLTFFLLENLWGLKPTIYEITHVIVHDYVPFVTLLFALYMISKCFVIRLKTVGTPFKNVIFLTIASVFTSFIGTTGASVLMIKPFIRMNRFRKHKIHHIVFFIILVTNVSGCLTPLGDPPLFLGYLHGVPFFWPLINLFVPFLLIFILLLGIYFVIDSFFFNKENKEVFAKTPHKLLIGGVSNIFLLTSIIIVLVSSRFVAGDNITIFSFSVTLREIVREAGLLIIILLTFIKNRRLVKRRGISLEPMSEVIRVFAVIFVTITPVSIALFEGLNGPFATLLTITKDSNHLPFIYFWLTGLLSAFLDNAPTYLLFFGLASGNPLVLTTTLKSILVAISLGSVMMGALTYIGNAPNLMVRAIAKQSGVDMPDFLEYMLWSWLILIPVFLVLSFCFLW